MHNGFFGFSGVDFEMSSSSIRVLIVDDSSLMRTILSTMLDGVPDIQVVGQAADGHDAVRMTLRLQPDLIMMDIRMPRMDGIEATRHIMSVRPTPIVVVASGVTGDDDIAFNAIEAGALTVVEKPRALGTQDFEAARDQLIKTIRTMAGVTVVRRRHKLHGPDGIGPMTAMLYAFINRSIRVIAVGASTGGPPVLNQIFSGLSGDFSIPIVVVQHIMPAFVQGLTEWLSTKGNLVVSVAKDGERIAPGKVLVAPGDAHLVVTSGGIVRLETSAPIQGQRPSATRLFESVASTFGSDAVGIILTGMGEDGVSGLEVLSRAGAHIIAQDETSSAVFGMPKVAIERGIVDEVLTPEQISVRLTKLHRHMQSLEKGRVN
jgi:two-component system chemotaxis response regulator CheB